MLNGNFTSVSGNAGSDQVLTTTVTRPSDNTPLSGWTIRYKLVSNRKATLSSPSNNEQLDTIDVTTDANGQAAIRVTPNGNQAGVVYVTTEVIRPADISLETPAARRWRIDERCYLECTRTHC